MSKKMLVDADPHQTRVAVLEDDRLTEVFVERTRRHSIVGNIYKGRVNRVLPGMQAAFVGIGLERDVFLYVADVGGTSSVEEDTVAISLSEIDLTKRPSKERSIDDLLRVGQEIVVQITKDALPNKGARVTTHLTLPSRYVVMLPGLEHIGISRRIQDPDERARLEDVLQGLKRHRTRLDRAHRG